MKSINQLFADNLKNYEEVVFTILNEKKNYQKYQQLYHYTSLNTFQDIIRTNTLRATSIYMMNDPNELKLDYEPFLERVFKSIVVDKKFIHMYNNIYMFPAFSFSLTEREDDMYFWDKYGDKHRGIRIGFTPQNFIDYWKILEGIEVYLVPVIYQNYEGVYCGEYAKSFSEFQTNFINEIREYFDAKEVIDTDRNMISYYSAIIASMIKREEWAIENEWRIICIARGHVDEAINGCIVNGIPKVSIENTGLKTLELFVNTKEKGLAAKNILKIGSLAENEEYIKYVLTLLFKHQTGVNYFNDNISRSIIQTRN